MATRGQTGSTSVSTDSHSSVSLFLQRAQSIVHAYPTLRALISSLTSADDIGKSLVRVAHVRRFNRIPGRCALLVFSKDRVEHRSVINPEMLRQVFDDPSLQRTNIDGRLWILEDLESSWVDVLGSCLAVDPVVFSEQTNTFNFTDSETLIFRGLPSMIEPERYFTLRYFEVRQLSDPNQITTEQNQTTFAMNRRRYERWRDIDTANIKNKWRHGIVRRCASFWSNRGEGGSYWDAVMLVDPPFDSFTWQTDPPTQIPRNGIIPLASGQRSASTILQDPKRYIDRTELWSKRSWRTRGSVQPMRDDSLPYHAGPQTLTRSIPKNEALTTLQRSQNRNLSSPFDEMVFYWTTLASPELISSTSQDATNSTHYLLKYIATYWMNQLDLIGCSVALSEYLADDHEARVDFRRSSDTWRRDLESIASAARDVHYMRRQLRNFEYASALNLERLGSAIGADKSNVTTATIISEAQRDFSAIHSRLLTLSSRLDGLSGVANDLSNLHTAFRAIHDGEFGLRISLFAGIVFPMTLVTSMLSMDERYLPGQPGFWIFWAAAVPLVLLFVLALVFGPYLQHIGMKFFVKSRLFFRA